MPELDRRDFLKVVGLSAGAAAATACSDPVETLIPYLNQPEEIVPGLATYYASTCRECPSACSIQVKTREGRPIKVDGNAQDPISGGRLCMRGQASLARTYDASRLRQPLRREGSDLVKVSWDEAIAMLVQKLGAANGKAFFLNGLETGTFGSVIDGFMSAIGSPGQRLSFEVYSHDALRAANNLLFGQRAVPRFAFEKADVLVSFGADFLETWLSPTAAQRGFTEMRREGRGYAVYVGPRLSLSGSNCDLWIDPEPGTEMWVALGLAKEVAKRKTGNEIAPLRKLLEPYGLDAVATKTGIAAERLERLAVRIAKANAPLALPPGQEVIGPNATAFAAAVQVLNFVSGAVGNTVVFGPDHKLDGLGTFADLKALADKLAAKQIDVLFVHGANPVYAAPQLKFDEALGSTYTVAFASALDETASRADLVLPDHTPYESWGDAEVVAGVKLLQQPTIRPLFDTRATGDVLIDVAAKLSKPLPGTGTVKDRIAAGRADFAAALARGGDFQLAAARPVSLAASAATLTFDDAPAPSGEGLGLLVYPSINFYDGRSARIPMMQEIPDPVTKLVWDSYAEMHPLTARELGIEAGDVVTVKTPAGEVELAAFPHSALRPGLIAIAAGQGHQPVEPDAPEPDRHQRRNKLGVNAFSLLPLALDEKSGAQAWLSTRAQVASTGRKKLMPQTQATFDQEGRGVAQATTLAALVGSEVPAEEGLAHQGDVEHETESHHSEGPYSDAMHLQTEQFDPTIDATNPNYRWGMSIDLDACTGCGACVAACAVENNIPSIGETLARQGRELHWIRIERYVEEHEDGELEVRHVPMLCQHCGSAPCETVCPVFATYHNEEGLNVMVPNRCIGTRYCGNNCPYKVRRFNYFSYNWDVRDPEQWGLNPDVIVRAKGVMEKCTFCVQRINGGKDAARKDGNRVVRDGEVTPACAQTCPSDAIVFGNFKDPESRLSKLQEDPRAYWVFHHLNTRPAVTYQKSILRPETEEA
jgi:anaerobic selenocysteine-containing dehydrogenase/Fe-S-cluster-containing dehydrogenase component